MARARVGVVMGSKSDWEVMREACAVLKAFGVPYEAKVVSAHRTPDAMFAYAESARGRGLRCIVAGAGGAAHLPGMVASYSPLPVIGVPVKSSNSIDGWDSVLSILQMPGGVPVATVALNVKSRGGSGDAARTIWVCEALVADGDPMVVKALSWALRSLVGVAPEAVRAFLSRHGDGVPALVRREVRNKLETGLKRGG